MEEYDILLDTEENSIVIQYPLNTELPFLKSIKTKNEDTFAETVGETEVGISNFRAPASTTINKYYILSIGDEIVGEPVKSIFQLRPFLEETEETVRKTEKKETKTFSMNETQEELENRMKNPNYVADKFRKSPWKEYEIGEIPVKNICRMERIPRNTFTSAGPISILERVRETVYNARVVNLGELKNIYPSVSTAEISQILSEMTVEVLNRYILKPEYFNDLSTVLIKIVNRMKIGHGILTLTKEELINSSEGFDYILSQIAHKEKNYYRLKGYFE